MSVYRLFLACLLFTVKTIGLLKGCYEYLQTFQMVKNFIIGFVFIVNAHAHSHFSDNVDSRSE